MKTSCLSSIICDFDMFIDLIANNLTESKRPDQPAYLFSWYASSYSIEEINQKKHASPLDSALPPVSHVKSTLTTISRLGYSVNNSRDYSASTSQDNKFIIHSSTMSYRDAWHTDIWSWH